MPSIRMRGHDYVNLDSNKHCYHFLLALKPLLAYVLGALNARHLAEAYHQNTPKRQRKVSIRLGKNTHLV